MATTSRVPKKIPGEPVKGVIRNDISTPENRRPDDSLKMWPRPRSAVGNCSYR
jgi:hypothetical protein